jgi:hypothetical protein
MAKITRGEASQGSLSQANISEGVAAQSGAGLGAIGQEVSRTGAGIQQSQAGALSRQLAAQVEQMGREYWEQSKRTHQTAVLTNSISDATIEYEKAIMDRKQQVVDKNGNPTFTTLGEDVRKIGEDIREKIASKIIDPEVASRFRNDFTQFTTSKQISAMKAARRQQISFAKVSLDNGLGALLKQGVNDTDPDNLTTYETQGHKLLDDALAGGLVSTEEHTILKDQFSVSLREGMLEGQIQADTPAAASMLQSEAKELGISEESKANLDKQLEAKVGSDILEAEKVAQQAQRDQQQNRANLAREIEDRIAADAIREDELLRQEKNLSPSAFKKLKKEMVKRTEQRRKEEKKLDKISTAIDNGDNILDVPASAINEHYKREVERQATMTGRKTSLFEKAQLASVYGRSVTSFARELNGAIINGDVENAQDIISAYTYLNDRNSRAIEGNILNNKNEAVVTLAKTLVDAAGKDPIKALAQARERLENQTPERVGELRKEFNKMDEFSFRELEETTADAVGAESYFVFNEEVSIEAQENFRDLTREAYLITGDIDSAKEMAANQMNRTHGITNFNGQETYMFAPPEKLFPGLPVEDITKSFQSEITQLLGPNVNFEDVKIVGDDVTKRNFSYAVTQKKIVDGIELEVMVQDDKGANLRWIPDLPGIQESIAQRKQEEALGREQEIEKLRLQEQQRIQTKGQQSTAEQSLEDLRI